MREWVPLRKFRELDIAIDMTTFDKIDQLLDTAVVNAP